MAMTLRLQEAGGFQSLPLMIWMITPWFMATKFQVI